MYKIVDELILLISRVFSLKILSGSSLHFVGIKVFIVGYEMECEKSVSTKQGVLVSHFAIGMSHKFQSLVNRKARLYFLSYSDPTVLTLQLPACSTRVLDSGKSPLASQSQDPITSCLLMHTLDQFFTLSHTHPLHYSHLNTGFLNVELCTRKFDTK